MKKLELLFTLLLLGSAGFAQTRQFSGTVRDSSGSPLPSVTIKVQGRNASAVTGSDGTFTLTLPTGGARLQVSSVGYGTESINVNSDDNNLSIILNTSSAQLSEVVVTALGIRKQRKSLGYSTTEVPGSNFTESRATNLGNALTGQVAGVSVAGAATGPSGSSRVTIRGNSSISGNNQPLYVIDGVPLDVSNKYSVDPSVAGYSGQWGGADYGDALSTINPDDIETIQVLKGVAASALYGYRGGNGAILITTKSGARTRGFGVELNNNLTFDQINDLRDYQYEFGQGTQGKKPTTANDALGVPQSSWGAKMDGSQAVNSLGNTYAYNPAKDNFKNFFRTGVSNQTSVALIGSGDLGHYRLGLSNLAMNPVIPNSSMQQQGVNFNGTFNVSKKFQVSLSANYVFEKVKNRASFSDAPGNVIAAPLYLANSFDIRWLKNYTNAAGNEILPGTDQYFNNPYFVANNFQNSTNRNRLTSALSAKYNILDWLSLQAQITRDGYTYDVVNIVPTGTGYQPAGSLTQSTLNYHEMNGNFLIDANKKFGDFALHGNIGGNSQDDISTSGGIYGASPFNVPFFYSPSNITNKPFSYGYSHYRVNSIYASADVGYKDYLFLTVTARKDWFSTLNPNTNSYLYPSVAGSFVFSDALRLPDWITFGKLRASYAESSNGTTPYTNLLTYALQGYSIFGQPLGYVSVPDNTIPNAFLKPVSIKEEEIGLNMQFLQNRLGLDAAVYNKNTYSDIVKSTVSQTTGFERNIANLGKIRNRGIELLLNATPIKTRSFTWNTSFNVGINDNKVLDLGGVKQITVNGAFPRWGDATAIQDIVGYSYSQIVGYAYKRDANANIIYDTAGRPQRTSTVVPLGSGVYKTTGGFNNDFHYKNFTLSFLFDFKYGAKIYSQTNLLLYNNGLQKTTLQGRDGGYVGPGVTEDGKPNQKSVNAQIYWTNLATGGNYVTEEFVYDASFIKLRNASLSYSLPASVVRKTPFKGLTLSIVGRNLAILMKHTPNIDPESNLNATNGQGLELSGYPAVRNIGFNLNIKF